MINHRHNNHLQSLKPSTIFQQTTENKPPPTEKSYKKQTTYTQLKYEQLYESDAKIPK